MGLRLNLQHASWLAYLLAPDRAIPPASLLGEDAKHASQVFAHFISQLETGFMSGRGDEKRWAQKLQRLYGAAEAFQRGHPEEIEYAVRELREFLGDRAWTALILPSGRNPDFDRRMCSREYLRSLVDVRPEDAGLILQLEEPPTDEFVLSGLFPAFRTALSAANEWPGILIWRPVQSLSLGLARRTIQRAEEAMFFPVHESPQMLEESRWLVDRLADLGRHPLRFLAEVYRRRFDFTLPRYSEETTLIHLSDIHAGSPQAQLRLPRLPALVKKIQAEGGRSRRYLIVVSGDLMDTPNEENIATVRGFMDQLADLSTEPLITCWGNHDVRKGGIWKEDLRAVRALLNDGPPVQRFCGGRLGVVIFDSVRDGYWARGFVGNQQLVDLGTRLDRKGNYDAASLIGVLHHHPVQVQIPAYYKPPFYERWLGRHAHKTDRLKDADQFNQFVEERNFGCVLHGHKHIPHISKTPGNVPVYGCGSSVGKLETVDGSPYVSVNVVSFEPNTRRLTVRLLAERIDGGGLREMDRAEILSLGIMRSRF